MYEIKHFIEMEMGFFRHIYLRFCIHANVRRVWQLLRDKQTEMGRKIIHRRRIIRICTLHTTTIV